MSAAILGGIPVRTDPWPSWPTWDEAEERALLEVLHSGEWGGYAAGVGEFEQRFAALTGTAHCVTTSNGTVSLVAALAALGVSAGDEVLVPAYTFAATANAVALLGARPVFVDIEPGTWNLDAAAAEAAITDRTRAIVPVHFAGHPVDLDVLLPLAERHGLAVLEDAAHAPGSSWRGRPVGSFGSLASFSFQGFKNLTAGEGGAVVGDDRALIDRAWGMANHGRVRDGSWYEHREQITLVTTSDGNHGWALAKVAHDLGVGCRVQLPDGVGSLARQGIRALGAELVDVGGDYDDVVAETAAGIDPAAGELLVQDTSWAGYTTIPRAIVDGYRTLAAEAEEQATAQGARADLVLVPMGVGCLGQAMVEHFRGPGSDAQVVAVEPGVAACVTASLAAGARVTVDTGRATTMAGLRCGTPSEDAWPVLATGLSGGVAITDAESAAAAADLAAAGVPLGPCGAAPLAGLRALLADPTARDRLGLGPESTVLLIGTEGPAANGAQ